VLQGSIRDSPMINPRSSSFNKSTRSLGGLEENSSNSNFKSRITLIITWSFKHYTRKRVYIRATTTKLSFRSYSITQAFHLLYR
jgi:hypothetical protein